MKPQSHHKTFLLLEQHAKTASVNNPNSHPYFWFSSSSSHPTTPINTAPCQTSCQKILFNPSFPISSPRTTCTIFSSLISSNNVLDTISHILDTFCVTCKPNFAAKALRRRDVRVGGRGVPSGVRVDWRSIIPAISRWRALVWGMGG